MCVNNLKSELVRISRRCYDRQMICAAGGNISCRVPGENAMFIKGSGSAFSDMTEEDVVKVDLEGNMIEGTKKLSKEWKFHAGIYKERPDVMAVIHIHPPFSTAVASNLSELPLVTNHSKVYLKHVPTINVAPSGSDELAEYVVTEFEDSERVAILMKEHGIVTVGGTLKQAFYLAEMVEDTAKIALFSKLAEGDF